MDRVIVDTNLWISFLLTKNYPKLGFLLTGNHLILLFSNELLDEFIEVTQRTKFKKYFTNTDLQNLVKAIREKAEFIKVNSEVKLCRDLKDNFLLTLAKDGKASHLITGDKDLLVLQQFMQTKICTISDYLSNS